MTKQKYDAIIIGTGQVGPPHAKRLFAAVSKLIPTMFEELGLSAA
jgi:hypothetical protein